MRRVPKAIRSRISFFKSRIDQWLERASEIGSSTDEVNALKTMVDEASAAYQAQATAQQAARSATQRLNQAVEAMSNRGASIIGQVESKARISGNGIYSLASLRPAKSASPIAAPGTPYRLSAQLRGNGALLIKWKCKNPRGSVGTMYEVRRRIGFNGELLFLGSVGTRQFIDDNLPPAALASGTVTYQITAMRSKRRGSSAEFPVPIGVVRNGAGGGAGERVWAARNMAA